jgi:hypothetical protein
MKILKTIIYSAFVALALSSCTVVTSTNVPGKTVTSIPKTLLGHYQLILGEDFSAVLGEDYKMTITFKKDRMVINDGTSDSETMLGDSLFVSMVGKSYYLSMGAGDNYTVYKLKKEGKDLIMYSLFAEEGVTASDLIPFFKSVNETPGEVDENGEVGASTMSVTIDDSKIEDYFNSEVALKEPYRLKYLKKKK